MPNLTKSEKDKISRNEKEDIEFAEMLDRFKGGNMAVHEVLRVGTTPYCLRVSGADAMPIKLSQSVLANSTAISDETISNANKKRHTEPHSISFEILKGLPKALRCPLIVYRGNKPNTMCSLLEIQDDNKQNIFLSISFDKKKNSAMITTILGKKNAEKVIETAISEKTLLAINKKVAETKLTNHIGLADELLATICYDNSIAYTDKNVKPLKEILQNILPEGEEKPMNEQNINLSSLDPAAAEIIKQLQAQLQQQSAENAALKNEMAEVKSEVSEIKAENAALRTEVTELKAEVKEQGSRIDALESSAEIVKAFTAAMSETKSFEQTMAEVQSVTRQITGCEKAEFFCFDNNENKFFSSEDGKTRNWQDNTEQLGSVLFSSEISFADESRTKAFIPVAGNDGQQIGVLVAEKSDGFSETDLKDFSIGGDIMNTIDLAIKKEQNHLTAVTDNLTHLKNRDGLAEYQKTTLVPNSESNIPVNIIMCDIDHFKSINDTYGHDAGDIILKNVAKVLSEHTRSGSDCAFRMGGEEMVCVLNCSPADAIAAAERLRKAVEDTVHTVMHNGEPTEVKVTISVGIHEMQSDRRITPENVAEIFDAEFKQSDNAVYAAKETGRNRVVSADKDTMTDYLVSRAAEAIIDANNLSDTVNEVKENVLKNFSVEEINEHLLGVDTPLAGRVCEQISEFMSANEYFSEKSGKETGVQEHEEAAHGSPGEQSPKEKADDISNSAEECTAEFREMQSNTNELKDTIKDAAEKTAEIVQNKNKEGDAI